MVACTLVGGTLGRGGQQAGSMGAMGRGPVIMQLSALVQTPPLALPLALPLLRCAAQTRAQALGCRPSRRRTFLVGVGRLAS